MVYHRTNMLMYEHIIFSLKTLMGDVFEIINMNCIIAPSDFIDKEKKHNCKKKKKTIGTDNVILSVTTHIEFAVYACLSGFLRTHKYIDCD